MVLSRPDILDRIKKGKAKPNYRSLWFSPDVSLEQIGRDQCSIDLRLGLKFTIFKDKPHVSSFRLKMTKQMFEDADLWEEKEYKEGDLVPLKRGELVLAQTLETVHLPHDLLALVEGRSSWARMGVGIHVTAPKIDPGWNKPITLELTNHSKADYDLEAGREIPCQLILLKLLTPLKEDQLYGTSAEHHQFAHSDKPIPTKPKKK